MKTSERVPRERLSFTLLRPDGDQAAPLVGARDAVLKRDGRWTGENFHSVDLVGLWQSAKVQTRVSGQRAYQEAVHHDLHVALRLTPVGVHVVRSRRLDRHL